MPWASRSPADPGNRARLASRARHCPVLELELDGIAGIITAAIMNGADLEAAGRVTESSSRLQVMLLVFDHMTVQIRHEDLAVVSAGEAQACLKWVQLPSHKSGPQLPICAIDRNA